MSEERFDKIRYYLKHGTYPSGADRAEKSRLRSAATHYKLLPDESGQGERLMLKDKEVVSDPQRQYEIARNVHALQHGGINKTTATIAEKFHWVRIKETVSLVIKNCPDCKETAAKAPTVRPLGDNNTTSNGNTLHSLRKPTTTNGQNIDPNSMIERLVHFDQISPAPPTRTISLPASSSPEPAVPVANMHVLQHYNDIPLDPQIMGPPYNLKSTQFIDLELQYPPSQLKDEQQQADTRMATERHVRAGDEPMAYQDGRGMVHDGEAEDMELEELLSRS